MDLTTWLSLATICAIGAMSPGPSLAVVLKHAIYNSAKHGIVASLSHGAGVGIYAALSLLGLGGLILKFPTVYQLLVYGGAAYLAYMGLKILTSKSTGLAVDSTVTSPSYKEAIQEGFSIAFLNPKLAIFFIALFSQFIDPEKMTFSIGFLMCMTVLLIDAIWYFMVSMISAKARDKFDLTKKSSTIDKILGTAFLLLAIRVIYLALFN